MLKVCRAAHTYGSITSGFDDLCFTISIRSYFSLVVAVSVLILLLTSCGGSGGASQPPPPSLSLTASPNAVSISPSDSFSIKVTATTNTSSIPTLVAVQLPSGITTTTTFPMTIPDGGATISFQSSPTITAGTYSPLVPGEPGSLTAPPHPSPTPHTAPPSPPIPPVNPSPY